MAFDSFLKLGSVIPGESTDDKHKDWIEVLSYHWGVSQPASGSSSSGGARAAERANISDMSFVHTLDKASPKLFGHCCDGKHIPEATLELCRATGDKQKYMEYKMTDVIVSSVRPGGAAQGGEPLPLEEFSINFGKIELIYTCTDHKTGKPSGDVKGSWDTTTNKGS
jgi:type VI secretion system secreted protein Hcp